MSALSTWNERFLVNRQINHLENKVYTITPLELSIRNYWSWHTNDGLNNSLGQLMEKFLIRKSQSIRRDIRTLTILQE